MIEMKMSRRRQARTAGSLRITALVALVLALSPPAVATGEPVAVGTAGDAAEASRQILVTLKQKSGWKLPQAGSTPKGYGRRGAYGKSSARNRREVGRLARRYGLKSVAAWPIDVLDVHCVVFEIPPEATAGEIVERLGEDPRVESVQPMHLFRVEGAPAGREEASAYNDPFLHLQHGVRSMQVAEAHRWALGRGVKVAVVDTGIDIEHPELEGRVTVAEDFVDRGAQSFMTDLHGTAVAGVIASSANNGIGIVGVAPNVELLALRACWAEDPSSTGALCNSFTLARALAFAIERRPDVLNLSLTGPPDPLLERLVRVAVRRGVVVVAAAEASGGRLAFPASVAGVVAVRAAGKTGAGEAIPPVAGGIPAPGVDILTIAPHGAYDFMSGSSFAAAHVSGIAALLLEHKPRLAADGLRDLLVRTARQIDSEEGAEDPVVNACVALAEVVAGGRCAEPAPASTS